MAAVRLLVLGVIRLRQPTYGYAVRQELLSWRAETWTNVKPGSIYHALKQLTAEDKLRAVRTEDSSQGPGRTLFELTDSGEAEFFERLREALTSVDMEELGAGIAFMDALPRPDVVELLTAQRRATAAIRDELLAMVPEYPGRDDAPYFPDLLELWSGVFDNFTGWTARLLRRLEDGEYRMAGEPPRPSAAAADPDR
ncbi:PadR family transcriptional regulator [Nocardia blacklockiae]|uniref:PadR family transcriptional regulator n=1 Tax=Nocardia blacklockiae TaxID=480036 RepID=UPI00189587FE|nr:helix-turn-helix transcriptional regulator [Nocardia blacklockiae]MBF6170559.1 PadR family transcriptional regulator [Nocardia blacklockiae]